MTYNPRHILITGVAGFIGSNVAISLTKRYPDYRIIGIDKMSYCSSLKNLDPVMNLNNFEFIKADIKDLNFMSFIFKRYDIDTVINFAAYSHVDHSFGNSILFTDNNVVGTHVLLEVAKNNNVKRFIHVSTDEVYGSQLDSQSDENSLLDPTNPYAATKAAAEHIVRSYKHSFGLPTIITRGNNVYGPRQYPEKVIPKFIYRLTNNLKCKIHGSGKQMRSFLHVDDVSRAFDVILHSGKIGETYNIGCSDEHSILSVAHDLAKIIKPEDDPEKWVIHGEDREFNDQRYFISTKKLELLGWKQKIKFTQGLKDTVNWYHIHKNYWPHDEIILTINKH